RDFVFRADLFFAKNSGALPRGIIQSYSFVPDTITTTAGSTVTWYNDDQAFHTVTASDASFNSGTIDEGSSFSRTFDQPGSYDYACTIHPAMKGKVVVAARQVAPTATPTVPELAPSWLFASGLLALGWLAARALRRRRAN